MKLALFVILLCFLGVYLKAEEVPKSNYTVLEKSNIYIIYCVQGYKWIKWDIIYSSPVQMFEYYNAVSVPVMCKMESK